VSKKKYVIGIGLAMFGSALMSAAAPAPGAAQAGGNNPIQATAESIAAGQKVYQRYCRGCHGPNGEGGPQAEGGTAPSNLTDAKWDHGSSDGAIFTVIKNGIGPEYAMETWGDRISDTDIWHVVNYIRSLAKQQQK